MTEGKKKNQHYVPQSYLRHFAIQEQIYAFGKDKYRKQKKWTFNTNIRNIASENYFYDLPTNMIPQELKDESGINEQFIEDLLSEIEGSYATLHKTIISTYYMTPSENLYYFAECFTPEQKTLMSFYLTLQIIRTKEFREHTLKMHESMYKRFIDIHMQMEFPDYSPEKLKINVDKDKVTTFHASYLFDQKFIMRVASTLRDHIWMIGVNETTHPLYTSDSPIVKKPHKKHPFLSYNGYGAAGIEIAFPLTSKLILIMRERTYHSSDTSMENKFIRMSSSNVEFYNSLQVFQSYRQVYCQSESFELAERICEKHPYILDIDRNRFSIN